MFRRSDRSQSRQSCRAPWEICPLNSQAGGWKEALSLLSLSTDTFKPGPCSIVGPALISIRVSGLHQPGGRAAGGGILVAVGQRQIGFRAHLDQPRRGPLEFVGFNAVG